MGWFGKAMDFFNVEAPEVRRERLERLKRLEKLTAIVDAAIRTTWPEVGKALAEIRDRELYKATHETFEDFAQERWKMSKTHAYRLIAAAETISNLSPTGDKAPSERMIRPLTSLPAHDQIAAYEEAQAEAGDEPLTLALIERAASKRKPAKKAKRVKPTRLRVPGAIVVIEPGKAFTSVEDALQYALDQIRSRKAA